MYLDRLKQVPAEWGVFPRIRVWTTKLVNAAKKEDRFDQGGDYGKVGCVDVAYGEQHPYMARDTMGPQSMAREVANLVLQQTGMGTGGGRGESSVDMQESDEEEKDRRKRKKTNDVWEELVSDDDEEWKPSEEESDEGSDLSQCTVTRSDKYYVDDGEVNEVVSKNTGAEEIVAGEGNTGGKELVVEGKFVPVEGKFGPVEGKSKAVEGESVEDDGKSRPVVGKFGPIDGKTKAIEGEAVEDDGKSRATEGEAVEGETVEGEAVEGEAKTGAAEGEEKTEAVEGKEKTVPVEGEEKNVDDITDSFLNQILRDITFDDEDGKTFSFGEVDTSKTQGSKYCFHAAMSDGEGSRVEGEKVHKRH